MSDFVDYYAVLQIQPDAEPEVVEKAFKALIFKYHPDRHGDDAKARAIIAAHHVLSDADRRASYDYEYAKRESAKERGPSAKNGKATEYAAIPDDVIDRIVYEQWKRGAMHAAKETAVGVASAALVTGVVVGATAQQASKEVWEARVPIAKMGGALIVYALLAFLAAGVAMAVMFGSLVGLAELYDVIGCLPTLLLAVAEPVLLIVLGVFSWNKIEDAQRARSARLYEASRKRVRPNSVNKGQRAARKGPVRASAVERRDRAVAMAKTGKSVAQIAQELGVTVGTVKKYLRQAAG